MTPTITINSDADVKFQPAQKAYNLADIFRKCKSELVAECNNVFNEVFKLDLSDEQLGNALVEFSAFSFTTKLFNKLIAIAESGDLKQLENVVRFLVYKFSKNELNSIAPETRTFVAYLLDTILINHFSL